MTTRYLDLRHESPLFGRLRGVCRRGELRPTISDMRRIYSTFDDPHLVARGETPASLPQVLSNDEHQLVVQDAVLADLKPLVPDLESVPVRLEGADGQELGGRPAVAGGGRRRPAVTSLRTHPHVPRHADR